MIGNPQIQIGRMLGVLLLTVLASGAHAVEVAAQLSENTSSVGRPIQFQIQIEGAASAEVPTNFAVEGLDIREAGKSMNIQFDNLRLKQAVTYNYLVVPEREGNFTIPSLAVTVGDTTYKTKPQNLRVIRFGGPLPGGSGQPQSLPSQQPLGQPQSLSQLFQQMQQMQQQVQQQVQQQMQQAIPAPPGMTPPTAPAVPPPAAVPPPSDNPVLDKLAYAELIIPETKVYVGQTIPVEIRFYFDARYRVELVSRPEFGGEGFTAEKLSEPQEKAQTINGIPFNIFSLKTAITPLKAGTLALAPVKLPIVITLPTNRPPPDDFFGGLFGAVQMGEQREVTVQSNGVELEVKALPKQGQPPGFAGAIGRFTLDAEATPREATAGEPITLKLRLKGQGNFNAITEPELVGKDGWRIYPGSTDFTPSDDTGFGGEKIFESMLVALAPKSETPGAEFSYFDPMAEKYVTLTTPPVPVKTAVGKAAAPSGSPAPAPGASAPTATAASTPAPAPTTESAAASVLPDYTVRSFQSVFHRPEFWIANAAALLAFLALLAFWGFQRAGNSRAAQAAQARKQARRLLDEMANRSLEPAEFCEKGGAFLEKRVGSTLPEALGAAGFSGEEIGVLQPMLNLRDEARYGVGRTGNALPPERRAEILAILKQWEAKS